jgi:GntR family transcriptional regulator
MLFDIRKDSAVPIYEQIATQVIFGVASGMLDVGSRIQSVRELASELVVNANTVARAYQELERAGVLTARRGLGMEITEEAPALCEERRRQLVQARVREALREAVASGLDADDVRRLVEEELIRVNGGR